MTAEEKTGFLNGHMWTLAVLAGMGVTVDDERLLNHLRELVEGTVSRVESPADLIADAERMAGELGIDADEPLRDAIRKSDPARRRVAMKVDRECAGLLLAFYTGQWPPLPELT